MENIIKIARIVQDRNTFGALPASVMSMHRRIAELSQGEATKRRRYRRVLKEDNWQVGNGTFSEASCSILGVLGLLSGSSVVALGLQFGSTEVAFCCDGSEGCSVRQHCGTRNDPWACMIGIIQYCVIGDQAMWLLDVAPGPGCAHCGCPASPCFCSGHWRGHGRQEFCKRVVRGSTPPPQPPCLTTTTIPRPLPI